MIEQQFLKGPQLFALARRKASALGLDSKGLKLEELTQRVQEKEGHESCFRKKAECHEKRCCWQASCGAM